MKNTKYFHPLVIWISLIIVLPSGLSAQLCSQPRNITQWLDTAGLGNLADNWVVNAVPAPPSCSELGAVVDGNFSVHLYSVNSSGHLIESFQQNVGGGWQVVDIATEQQGNDIGVISLPAPVHLQNTPDDIQVFVLDGNGNLQSYVTQNAPMGFSVFNITALSGSGATLAGAPAVIQVGATLHVYVSDFNNHLHDFVKSTTSNWQDIDLTQVYGGPQGVAPQPYFYGGNSIQIAAVGSRFQGDLLSFIELVNPDGSISSFPWEGDLTALAGGTQLTSAARPLVVGPTSADVAIFADDAGGNLVEYFKVPTANWIERNTTLPHPGATGFTPSALFLPSTSTDRQVRLFSNTNASHLFEYILNPETGVQVQSSDLSSSFGAGLSIFEDPIAISFQSFIEVFTLNN